MPVGWRRSSSKKSLIASITLNFHKLRRLAVRSFGQAKNFVLEVSEIPEIRAAVQTGLSVALIYATHKPIGDVLSTSWRVASEKLDGVFGPKDDYSSEYMPPLARPNPFPRSLKSVLQRNDVEQAAAAQSRASRGWLFFWQKNQQQQPDTRSDRYPAGADLDRTNRGRYRDRVDLDALSKAQRLNTFDALRLKLAIFFNRFRK